jgi:hypothetical protein
MVFVVVRKAVCTKLWVAYMYATGSEKLAHPTLAELMVKASISVRKVGFDRSKPILHRRSSMDSVWWHARNRMTR